METLLSLLPGLPWSLVDIITNVVAGLGAILLTYGVFLEAERRQDAVFTIGAGCLLVYALYVGNKIFAVAMTGFMIASFVELLEIVLGRHTHSNDLVENYKHPAGNKK